MVITGSNAKMLSSELSTLLAARYIEIPIHALSYTEFLYFHQLQDSDAALEKYLLWGGLPYLRLIGLEHTEQIKNYIQSVYDTVVLKDIVQREQIRNVTSFINLSRFVSDCIGKLVSPNYTFVRRERIFLRSLFRIISNTFAMHISPIGFSGTTFMASNC